MFKTNFYQVRWSWPTDIELWLIKMCENKTSLNLPCGLSYIGTIRGDMDPSTDPDIICDFRHAPFRAGSFDIVICDPPFSVYNKIGWVHQLADLTRDKIIFCGPMRRIGLKGFKPSYIITSGGAAFFLRLWQIFRRKPTNFTLDDFNHKKYNKYTHLDNIES